MKIALYKSDKGNLVDFLVNLFSGLKGYSHSELVFDGEDEIDVMYDFRNAECFSISGRENKARFKNIDLLNGKWDIFEIECYESHEELRKKARQYLNSKYDYLGIYFTWIIPIKWQNPKKFWCSELDLTILGWDNPHISPNDISKSKKVRKLTDQEIKDLKIRSSLKSVADYLK